MLSLIFVVALAQLDGGLADGPPPTPPLEASSSSPEVGAPTAETATEAPPTVPPLPSSTPEAANAADAGVPSVEQAEGVAPSEGFIKGELSVYLGSDRLVVKRNRIGVSAGVDRFGSAYYLLVEPQVDLRFLEGKLGIGIGVPLRFELFSFADSPDGSPVLAKNLGQFRAADYAFTRPQNFSRILKYVTYGRKEDHLFINIGQRYASSVGHGTLVRRYAPNIDIDNVRVSAQVDAYNDYAGFELLTNDIAEWNMLGGIAFVKPFGFFKPENLLLKTFSVGVSAATDWKAPLSLSTDPMTGVRQLDENGRLIASTKPVVLFGIDAEVKVVKTEHIDVKPYVDYSMLAGGNGGLTIGALGRFNVGTDIVNAFRVVAELRMLGDKYQPAYFDTFYEIERFMARDLGRNELGFLQYATKQEEVLSGRLGQRVGFYFEGSWGIRNRVALTVALEGVSNHAAKNFVAHIEVPALDFLQVFGSYYKRGFTDFAEFGKLDERSILFAGARLRTFPFLFINGRLYKTFRVNPDVQRYDNQFGFVVDLEIGYEFGK